MAAKSSAEAFRSRRLAREPSAIRAAIAAAEDHAQHIDAADTDLQNLAYVIIHCTRALALALAPEVEAEL